MIVLTGLLKNLLCLQIIQSFYNIKSGPPPTTLQTLWISYTTSRIVLANISSWLTTELEHVPAAWLIPWASRRVTNPRCTIGKSPQASTIFRGHLQGSHPAHTQSKHLKWWLNQLWTGCETLAGVPPCSNHMPSWISRCMSSSKMRKSCFKEKKNLTAFIIFKV